MKTQLYRAPFNQKIIFVDGLGRSGKFMLTPIIASLDKIEHYQMRWLIEQIPVYHELKHLTLNGAITLLRTEIELLFYDNLIGRNLNCRKDDGTSIFNSKNPKKYQQRMKSKNITDVDKNLPDSSLLFMTHEIMTHPILFFKAFPQLKIIHIKRHPIDVVSSWIKKHTPEMIYNRRNAMTLIQNHKDIYPWAMSNCLNTLHHLSHVDRTIKRFSIMNNKINNIESQLDDSIRKNICTIYFEDMVTAPKKNLKIISQFLNTNPTDYTSTVLEKERCPRKLNLNNRGIKFKKIEKIASKKYLNILISLSEEYENEK